MSVIHAVWVPFLGFLIDAISVSQWKIWSFLKKKKKNLRSNNIFIYDCYILILFQVPTLNFLWFDFLSVDERVPTELKKAIMQARMEKKLTQAQLAQVFLSLSVSLPPSLLCIFGVI